MAQSFSTSGHTTRYVPPTLPAGNYRIAQPAGIGFRLRMVTGAGGREHPGASNAGQQEVLESTGLTIPGVSATGGFNLSLDLPDMNEVAARFAAIIPQMNPFDGLPQMTIPALTIPARTQTPAVPTPAPSSGTTVGIRPRPPESETSEAFPPDTSEGPPPVSSESPPPESTEGEPESSTMSEESSSSSSSSSSSQGWVCWTKEAYGRNPEGCSGAMIAKEAAMCLPEGEYPEPDVEDQCFIESGAYFKWIATPIEYVSEEDCTEGCVLTDWNCWKFMGHDTEDCTQPDPVEVRRQCFKEGALPYGVGGCSWDATSEQWGIWQKVKGPYETQEACDEDCPEEEEPTTPDSSEESEPPTTQSEEESQTVTESSMSVSESESSSESSSLSSSESSSSSEEEASSSEEGSSSSEESSDSLMLECGSCEEVKGTINVTISGVQKRDDNICICVQLGWLRHTEFPSVNACYRVPLIYYDKDNNYCQWGLTYEIPYTYDYWLTGDGCEGCGGGEGCPTRQGERTLIVTIGVVLSAGYKVLAWQVDPGGGLSVIYGYQIEYEDSCDSIEAGGFPDEPDEPYQGDNCVSFQRAYWGGTARADFT